MTTQPTVRLLHNTPLSIAAHAIRQCHDSHKKSDSTVKETCVQCGESDIGAKTRECIHCGSKSFTTTRICGEKDAALIHRVGCKMKHESTLEHLNLTFSISNISRALLQELSRHRHMSLTVKSSRYTLSELKAESKFDTTNTSDMQRAMKYLVFTDEGIVNAEAVEALERLRRIINLGISNDTSKYNLIEAYKTSLTLTINVRSLRNLLTLRTAPSALLEFRNLANEIYKQTPDDYKYLLDDCIYTKENK